MIVLLELKMSLYRYFKSVDQVKPSLSSPDGELSLSVPSSSIEAANKKVAEVMEAESKKCTTNKRGTYIKYSATERSIHYLCSSSWHLSSSEAFQE